MIYERMMRPLLMAIDAEKAHNLAVWSITNPLAQPFLSLTNVLMNTKSNRLKSQMCGLPLENPIGLAAGFDKNAEMFPYLHKFGFGFVEIGTVTAHAQKGNEKPRLFRLKEDYALINRMGFNNHGAEDIAKRVSSKSAQTILGGNIGKSKVTPLEDAISDYEQSFKLLKGHVQYFVINVSSPNTPNLRQLQEKEPLKQLLKHLMALNKNPSCPLLLKIAPDLNKAQLEDIVSVVEESGIHGVIATNTTISRNGLKSDHTQVQAIGPGGLSGKPVKERSTEVLRFLRQTLPKSVDLIGVGGVFSGADAYEKIRAGACCVQIYTGFVYRGPATVFKTLSELETLLKRDGFSQVSEAIGIDAI